METPHKPNVANTHFSKKDSRLLGIDLHGWEQIMLGTLMAVGVAGVAVAVATGAVVVLQREENSETKREFESYKHETAARISEANAAGDQAKADAAKANEQAAAIQERAARLEKEAEDARLQAAQIMRSTAWRQLLPEQASVMASALLRMPGRVVLQWPANDPEAIALAIQFSKVFEQCGWKVSFMAQSSPTSVVWGFIIPDTKAPETGVIRQALTAAAIQYSTEKIPESGMGFGNAANAGDDVAVLLVGSRRPTLAQTPQ